jgi:prefoldin subunit 5
MTNIEYDLKEILIRLDGRFDKLESKIDKISEDIADLQVKVGVLSEKVEGITKRLDTQEFINRGVIIGLILAVLGGFAKVFGLTH